MKKKYYLQVTAAVSFCAFLFVLSYSQLLAQVDSRFEIVIKVNPEVFRFSEGKTRGTIQDLAVISPGIAAAFNRHNVDEIKKAFPDFKPEDRIKVIRTGETVTLSDRSNIHILRVRSLDDVDTLIEELSNISGVIYAESNYSGIEPAAIVSPDDPALFL